jgi:hypothetical protein
MRRLLAAIIVLVVVLTSAQAFSWYDRETSERSDLFFPARYELMHLRYAYSAASDLKESPGESVSYHMLNAGALYPVPITPHYVFSAGVNFYLYNFRLHNVTNYYNKNSGNVYFIGVPLSNTFFFGDNWMLDVTFMPALSSDLHDIGLHDFQWLGGVLASWIFSDIASMQFGVYASKEFWQYYPIPVLGFIVRPKSFFDMEVLLPQYLRLNFAVASFCKLFVQGEYFGFVWDMEQENSSGVPEHFLKFADVQVGAGAKFRPVKGFYIEVGGGVHPYRKYDFATRNNTQFNSRQKFGWYAETTFSFGEELFGFK